MTNGQREMITAMRRKRLSYTTISHEFAELVSDCTTYEKRILLDLMSSAKKTLRDNRRLFRP